MKFGRVIKSRILKTLSVAAIAVSIATPSGVSAFTYTPTANLTYREVSDKVDDVTDNLAPTYYKTSNYSESDALFAATRFHIFAYNDVQLNAHTNGNIAANHMSIAGSNSGTTGLPTELLISEVSYIKDFTGINSQILCNGNSPLVVGENVVVDTYDNGNGFTVKGSCMENAVQMNNSSVKNIFQETKGGARFIDMDGEFAKLKKLSKGLAEVEATADERIIDFTDWNNRKINVDMSKPYSLFSVKASDLTGNTPITITGYDKTGANSVIINVDLKDYTGGTFDFNSHIKYITTDGEQVGNKERISWEYGKVLWNFYDSGAADGCYSGKINVNGNMLGSILAPCASVETNQNFDGTAVCSAFVNHAETHRNDFLGSMPKIAMNDDNLSSSESTSESTTAVIQSTAVIQTTMESTTETTTKGHLDGGENVTKTTTVSESTTFDVTEPTTELTTNSTTETVVETTTVEDFVYSSSTTTTSEYTETLETSTEIDTTTTTETTTVEDITIIEDTTTSGQATEADATTETTTKKGSASDSSAETKTSESTTMETESTTDLSESSTESTTKDGNSSTGSSDSDKGNTDDKENELTTETSAETTTEDGDSSSGGKRLHGGGSSSDKAAIPTAGDPAVDNPSDDTDTKDKEDTEGVTTADNDTDVTQTEVITAAEVSELLTIVPAAELNSDEDNGNNGVYTVDSTTEQTTSTADIENEKLPQTGSAVNTNSLYGAGCGIIALGVLLVLKSKKKSA